MALCLQYKRSRFILNLEYVVARISILDIGWQLIDRGSWRLTRVHADVSVAQNDASEDLLL